MDQILIKHTEDTLGIRPSLRLFPIDVRYSFLFLSRYDQLIYQILLDFSLKKFYIHPKIVILINYAISRSYISIIN